MRVSFSTGKIVKPTLQRCFGIPANAQANKRDEFKTSRPPKANNGRFVLPRVPNTGTLEAKIIQLWNEEKTIKEIAYIFCISEHYVCKTLLANADKLDKVCEPWEATS